MIRNPAHSTQRLLLDWRSYSRLPDCQTARLYFRKELS
jgi:hypothetical protein